MEKNNEYMQNNNMEISENKKKNEGEVEGIRKEWINILNTVRSKWAETCQRHKMTGVSLSSPGNRPDKLSVYLDSEVR